MRNLPEARDTMWDDNVQAVHQTIEHFEGFLDHKFGKGFCQNHPEALTGLVQATMAGYGSMMIAAAIQDATGKR